MQASWSGSRSYSTRANPAQALHRLVGRLLGAVGGHHAEAEQVRDVAGAPARVAVAGRRRAGCWWVGEYLTGSGCRRSGPRRRVGLHQLPAEHHPCGRPHRARVWLDALDAPTLDALYADPEAADSPGRRCGCPHPTPAGSPTRSDGTYRCGTLQILSTRLSRPAASSSGGRPTSSAPSWLVSLRITSPLSTNSPRRRGCGLKSWWCRSGRPPPRCPVPQGPPVRDGYRPPPGRARPGQRRRASGPPQTAGRGAAGLRRRLRDHGRVFTRPGGEPLNPDAVSTSSNASPPAWACRRSGSMICGTAGRRWRWRPASTRRWSPSSSASPRSG
jgi:hypothetical protein